jgi:NADH-quinone oxidoreductase subunit J
MQQVIFVILAAVTLGAALMTVTTQNMFRAALWLILAFFGIAGIFIFLHAEFLAVMNRDQPRFNEQWGIVGGFTALLFVALVGVVTRVAWPVQPNPTPGDTIQQLGAEFVGPYVIPFEVASVLLVVAMIGAIVIARERE